MEPLTRQHPLANPCFENCQIYSRTCKDVDNCACCSPHVGKDHFRIGCGNTELVYSWTSWVPLVVVAGVRPRVRILCFHGRCAHARMPAPNAAAQVAKCVWTQGPSDRLRDEVKGSCARGHGGRISKLRKNKLNRHCKGARTPYWLRTQCCEWLRCSSNGHVR